MSLNIWWKDLRTETPLKIVDWATGSDEEVAKMIQSAHEGKIKLTDYWNIGDTRIINLSAGINSAGTTIPAQNVELVLAHKPTSTSYYGGGEFIVHQKDCLTVCNYMNSGMSNIGSFEGSSMKEFLNNTSTGYLSMLPNWLSSILLNAQVITAETYSANTNKITTCKIFLPAPKEVWGGTATEAGLNTGYSTLSEFQALEQWEWFKTSNNRSKNSYSSYEAWWERSPAYVDHFNFCQVSNSALEVPQYNTANLLLGVAPAMLI